MTFHILLIIIILIESLIIFQVNHSNFIKRLYLTIIFIQLYFISAFRSVEIGNDTKNYFELFTNLANGQDILHYMFRYEIGFLIYTKLLTYLSNNPLILNVISSFIILIIVFSVVDRNVKYVWLSILLFINLRYFYASLNILRQFLALVIIFYSFSFILKGKFLKFLITIFIASTFHITAILFLPIYFVRNLKMNKQTIILVSIIGILFFALTPFILEIVFKIFPKFIIYQGSKYFTEGIKLASYLNFLVYFFIIIIFSLAYNKIKIINDIDFRKINILFYIVFIGLILSLISIKLNLIDRVVIYFSFFNILLIPKTLELVQKKLLKNLLSLSFILSTLIYNLLILFLRPEWNHVYPFKYFWQQ